ncbi:hypothetical protein QYE76_012488 [Lolium multiflorum]|uniref:RING-type E3 ubiquitin transferase n=1 Tax=Lolium multiflorum TaxID=4521 RepID=A0AAD8X3Y9_LOLMU|nr:hypothetical protein QYE76_012488 [Lolium multiflorum]
MEAAAEEEKVFVGVPAVKEKEEKVSVAVPAVKEEKVFVAVPAEPRAGQSTLLWVLAHLYSSRATTIVVTHVHVPPQMIPIMGVKFHVSKMSADQVRLFRMAERQQVEEMLDDYIHRCSEIKVKCEKLVIENEDVASGLVELIRLHGITKLVIAAAADKQYSKKLNKPVSKTATEMMQRADPSCKIWFVCKEKLICVRDKEVQIAPSAAAVGQEVARLPFDQKEGNIKMEMGLDDEVEEARKALAELMSRALKESCRRQKADEEAAAYLQKAKVYEELYLEEVRKREELEAALARADREIAQLRRAFGQRNTPTEGPQHVMPTRSSSILAQHTVFLGDDAKKSDLGPEGWQPAEPVNGGRELEALLSHRRIRKGIPLSPSSVIPSPPP